MPKAVIRLSFFLDNNVPDSIGRYLQRRGHSVHRQRHHIPNDSPDPVVAMTAMKADRILVTQDKDFNNQRFQQARFAALSRISLSGPPTTVLPALKEHMHLVEYQWSHCVATHSNRMIVSLQLNNIRFRS